MHGLISLSVLETMPCAVVIISADGRVAFMNATARDLLGAQGVGRNVFTILRAPQTVACIETALHQGQPGATRHLHQDMSREAVYLVRATPFSDSATDAVCITFEDVTEQEEADRMRRDFVANVSHELKTPLTSLLGFIETLRGAARDDPKARERFLGIMAKEAARMSRLVTDLLSLSRVEGSAGQGDLGPVNLGDLVQSTLNALRPAAGTADVSLTAEHGAADLTVLGDADQLQQLLTNLVENGIKYGGQGGQVTVSVTRKDRDLAFRGPVVEVIVRDQGEGFDPIHIPRLTERFYRIDDHRSREKGGTGLGLAIAKHVVNRHGGRLRIQSTPGQGSQFSVVLPALDAAPGA